MATIEKHSFTHEYINALKPRSKSYDVEDTRVPDLLCRVSPKGAKTFFVYKKHKSKLYCVSIGRYGNMSPEKARQTAADLLLRIEAGTFVSEKERKKQQREYDEKVPTFLHLFEKYIERHARRYTKENSVIENEGYYDRYLKKWNNRKIDAIGRDEIEEYIGELNKKISPFTANRVLTLIRHIYNKAIEWRYINSNPTLGIRKFKTKSRDRFLQPDEIKSFFEAIDAVPDIVPRAYFYMALYTGQRKQNVLAMRWDQIDFVNELWHIPETKNGEPLTVPLIPQAIERLKALKQELNDKINALLTTEAVSLEKKPPRTDFQRMEAEARHCRIEEYAKHASEWVFPSEKGVTGHLKDPKKFWKRVLNRAGIENMRIHDIRRTLGSYEAIAGVNLPTISRSLGHRTMRSTQVYARLNVTPVRNAMSRAINMIEDIREGNAEKCSKLDTSC